MEIKTTDEEYDLRQGLHKIRGEHWMKYIRTGEYDETRWGEITVCLLCPHVEVHRPPGG